MKLISTDSARFVASLLDDPDDIEQARRLHAHVYQEKGWAGPIDLTDHGTFNEHYDRWHPMAIYFGVHDTEHPEAGLCVAGRMLDAGNLGAASLQTLAECDVDPEIRAELEASPHGTVVEISGLAKAFGANPTATLHLYREMWGHSVRTGHRHWLMACDLNLSRKLTWLYGESIQVAGNPTELLGSMVVPMHLRVPEGFDRLIAPEADLSDAARVRRAELVEFMLERTDVEKLTSFSRAILATSTPAEALAAAARPTPPPLAPPVLAAGPDLTIDLRTEPAAVTVVAPKIPEVPPGRVSTALWDIYSHVYDGLLSFWPYRHLVDLVAERADLPDAGTLLDTGCGTGNLIVTATDHHPTLDVIGIDASPSMLEVARSKLSARPGVQLVRGDILDVLPLLPDASIDRIVSVNVLYALSDRDLYWSELRRVITPDGTAVITNPTRGSSLPIIREHLRHAPLRRLVTPKLLGVFAVDTLISVLGFGSKFEFVAEEELVAEAERHGWKVDETIRCYGGPTDGINVLMVLHRRPQA